MPSIQTNLANTCRRRSCDLVTVKTSSAPKSRRFADGAAGQHNKNGVHCYTAVHIWRMLNCIFLLAKLKISQVYSRLKLRSVWRAVIESQFSKWKVSPFLFWYFFITEPENLWAQVYGMRGLVFMYYRFILKPIWKITSLYGPSSWVAADFHLFIPYADTIGHNVSFFFSRCSDNSIGCFESAN